MCFIFCRFWLIDIFFPHPSSECTLTSTQMSKHSHAYQVIRDITIASLYWLYGAGWIRQKGMEKGKESVGNVKLQCIFFMPTKVNANFTYLYLIEINDWCLIFSSMFGHLIIYKEIQILIIMWLVKLENLKLVGFQFCRVESKIYCYTKLSIWSHWGI